MSPTDYKWSVCTEYKKQLPGDTGKQTIPDRLRRKLKLEEIYIGKFPELNFPLLILGFDPKMGQIKELYSGGTWEEL